MYEESRAAEDVSAMTGGWWVAALVGVLSIAAGVIVVVKPSNSLATLAVVSGIFILADGIIAIVGAIFGDSRNAGLVAILGVLSVVVGVLLIRHPISGVTAVALLLGIWLIAAAVVRTVVAIAVPGDRIRRLVVAAILGIAGIVIISEPHIGYATLAVIVGIGFILYGASMLVLALALRSVGHSVSPDAHSGAVAT
ncbi:MAG TPA: DUF308 domain-containing protein [Solirubrobacteraceae bacterium]|nr:DUF308 domain-containing protein [Solirubrobacteraceae bacterium]